MDKEEYDDWVRFKVARALADTGPTYTTEEVRAHLKERAARWPLERERRKTYDVPLPDTLLLHGIPQSTQTLAAEAAEWLGFDLEHILLRFLFHVSFGEQKPFELYFAKDVGEDSEEPNEITRAAMRELETRSEQLRSYENLDDLLREANEHGAQIDALRETLAPDDLLIDGIADWELDLIAANAKRAGYTIGELVYRFMLQFEHYPREPFIYTKQTAQ